MSLNLDQGQSMLRRGKWPFLFSLCASSDQTILFSTELVLDNAEKV